MCLAKVYRESERDENLIMESVTYFEQNQGEITLTSLFNEKKTVPGSLKSINFNGSIVTIA